MRPQNEKHLTLVHGDFKGANYFLKNEGKLSSKLRMKGFAIKAVAKMCNYVHMWLYVHAYAIGKCVILPFEVSVHLYALQIKKICIEANWAVPSYQCTNSERSRPVMCSVSICSIFWLPWLLAEDVPGSTIWSLHFKCAAIRSPFHRQVLAICAYVIVRLYVA